MDTLEQRVNTTTREPLLCDWCAQPILAAHAIFYLAPERKLVHQRCPRPQRCPPARAERDT